LEHRPTGTRVLKINIAGSHDFRRAFEEYLRKLAVSAGHPGLVRLAEYFLNAEPSACVRLHARLITDRSAGLLYTFVANVLLSRTLQRKIETEKTGVHQVSASQRAKEIPH
jgi:hypothetical protein